VATPNDSAFRALCELMDNVPFSKNPYRGILTRVAKDFNYKGGRRSVFQAIKVNRNTEVMMAVARAVRAIEEQMNQAVGGESK